MKNKIFIGLIFLTSLSACYYDNEEELYPQEGIPSGTISYTANIQPIIASNCAIPTCHVPRGSGIELVTYEQVKAIADNGKLRDRVIVRMDMPQAQALPPNQRQLIQAWIDQGSPN